MDILIAEDDRITALKLQRALEKLGHVVSVARDGSEAWRLVCAGNDSLLISDWEMPGMDGIELCRLVRSRHIDRYTYVILVTARHSREDRLEGLAAGADDFLAKPLDVGDLVARLNVAERILAMQDKLRTHAGQLAELHAALERQNALLTELAVTDGLTGVSNRRFFNESLESMLSFAGRQGFPLSLVILDIDHFKAYNDNFGHPAGDEVLRQVAQAIRSAARVSDVVARYGGEEFAVVLPATDADGARVIAERLRSAIAYRPWSLRPVTASLGATTTGSSQSDAAQIVAEADRALYCSKTRGRNQVVHFDELTTHREALVAQTGS